MNDFDLAVPPDLRSEIHRFVARPRTDGAMGDLFGRLYEQDRSAWLSSSVYHACVNSGVKKAISEAIAVEAYHCVGLVLAKTPLAQRVELMGLNGS